MYKWYWNAAIYLEPKWQRIAKLSYHSALEKWVA